MDAEIPFYSIVIPNFRDPNIDECFETVRDIPDAEIIVVESEAETLSSNHKDKCRYYFSSERLLPGAARNLGASKARGRFLLFVDSDLILTDQAKNFLSEFRANPRAEIVFGLYSVERSTSAAARFQNSVLYFRFNDLYKNANLSYGQSSHFIVERNAFETAGGFNPYLRMREDTEFCYRAAAFGTRNSVVESFIGHHLKRFNFLTLIKDYFSRTYYAINVKLRFPRIFMNISDLVSKKMYLSYLVSLFWLLFLYLTVGRIDFNFLELELFIDRSPIYVLAALGCFLQPLIIAREIFSKLDFRAKLLGLLVWPLTFLAMAAGGVLAVVSYFASAVKNSATSVLDWLRLFSRVVYRNGMPIQIIQFVTSRCNLRCEHCFYKESLDDPNPGEQPLDLFKKLAAETKPLLWYAFGGGEPFVRKDLTEVYSTISRIARPKLITIPTNGWYVERVLQTTLRMLQENPRQSLIIQISIDGTKEIHDQIRGEGSFEKAMETFEKLKVLRNLYPRLQLSFITVVTDSNKEIYPEFIDELCRRQPNQININLFRYGYLDHPPLEDSLVESYREAVDHYERLLAARSLPSFTFLGARAMRLKEVLQKELIYKVAKHQQFVTPCTAGTLSYVIWEDGRLAPCEILPEEIGNLERTLADFHAGDWRDLFKSQRAKTIRKNIVETKCKCTYECAMSNNTFFSWPMTRKFASRYIGGLLRA